MSADRCGSAPALAGARGADTTGHYSRFKNTTSRRRIQGRSHFDDDAADSSALAKRFSCEQICDAIALEATIDSLNRGADLLRDMLRRLALDSRLQAGGQAETDFASTLDRVRWFLDRPGSRRHEITVRELIRECKIDAKSALTVGRVLRSIGWARSSRGGTKHWVRPSSAFLD